MKAAFLVPLAAWCLVVPVNAAVAPTELVAASVESADFTSTCRSKIEKELQALAGKPERGSMEAFAADENKRLLLAQWMLLHYEAQTPESHWKGTRDGKAKELAAAEKEAADIRQEAKGATGKVKTAARKKLAETEKRMATLRAERNAAWTLNEVASTPAGRTLLKKIMSDAEWMNNICFTGECVAPGRVIAIIAAVAEQHPDVYTNPMVRDIATATALEFARYNWEFGKALLRADYFIRNWKDDRLNTVFDTLNFFERRVVCGCKGNNTNGSVSSLEWALRNVHLPDERYTGCCWRCGYKLFNLYGDSIHGNRYYAPFDSVYGDNALQRTYEIGGVCGGLSHFGAFSACANGVPALTSGEPGHCSYIVYVNGKWTPAYSLTWNRDPHWLAWQGFYNAYSALYMGSELYRPEQQKASYAAAAARAGAAVAASGGKTDAALSAYRLAVELQPLQLQGWREYANFLRDNCAGKADAWVTLHCDVNRLLVPRYPEVAAGFLRQSVYEPMSAVGVEPEKMADCIAGFWDSVAGMGPDRWHIEPLLDKQLSLFAGKEVAPEQLKSLYGRIINGAADVSAYVPILVNWGNGKSSSMPKAVQDSLLTSTVKALQNCAGGMNDADRKNIAPSLILAVEKSRDIASFQSISRSMGAKLEGKGLPAFEPFAGKLISSGGLLFTSSTCRYDAPMEHWGVLEPVGGRFHTDNQKDAWGAVMLPRDSYISGVVIMATGSNHQRLYNMCVQVSETGEDGSWKTVGDTIPKCTQRVYRIPLPDVKARYVRILRKGGPDVFHLNGIYVYGRFAA